MRGDMSLSCANRPIYNGASLMVLQRLAQMHANIAALRSPTKAGRHKIRKEVARQYYTGLLKLNIIEDLEQHTAVFELDKNVTDGPEQAVSALENGNGRADKVLENTGASDIGELPAHRNDQRLSEDRNSDEVDRFKELKKPESFLFFDLPVFKVPTKLSSVTFAVTSWCNLKCIGCERTRAVNAGTWVDGHMTKEIFKKVLDNLPPISVALLQGVGEPTLNPDFLDICKLARGSGKIDSIAFHTNGITRDAEFLVEVSKYADNIIVSVDSLNKYYTDQVRQGTNVEKLIRCLRGLTERNVRVSINMVVSRTNMVDVVSTLGILNKIGPFVVNLQPFEGPEHGMLTVEDNNRLRKSIEQLLPYIPNIQFPANPPPHSPQPIPDALAAAKVEIETPGCKSKGQSLCWLGAPALSPYITRDGFITPCCRTEDPGKLGYSDLTQQSFAEMWQSEFMRRYVHNFIEKGDWICTGCTNNGRELFSTNDGPGDVAEAVEKVLKPAVNFANLIGDDEQAAQFHHQFARAVDAISGATELMQSSAKGRQIDQRQPALVEPRL
jgi:MoaA/NifB/PqqE/SkfB family radical SAM enzyme